MASARAAIVVVSHDGRPLLERFLPSAAEAARAAAVPTRLVVVDNASSDGSAAWVGRHFADALVVESASNRFFGGGNNLGARAVLAAEPGIEWLVFLNNDAEAPRDLVRALTTPPADRPEAAILGTK